MFEWLGKEVWWWLITGSIVTFIVTLIAIPWLILRLPADYFDHQRRQSAKPETIGKLVVFWMLLIAKNLAGIVLTLIGLSMLVLPGQGLLTILIGLSLVNFPGKYRLERYIVSRGPVLAALNWLRGKGGKPLFQFESFEQPTHLRHRKRRHRQ